MSKNSTKTIERLKLDLEAAQKTIESLKARQAAVKSTGFKTPGGLEKMMQLEKLVEHRTEELLKSRQEIEAVNANLESLIIERTRRLSEVNRELSVVSEIGRIVSSSLDIDFILNNAMVKLLEITGLKAGGYFLVHQEKGELYTAGGMNLSDKFKNTTRRAKIGVGISGNVALTGKTILVNDIKNSPLVTDVVKEVFAHDGFQGQISVPLKRQNRVIGVMNLVSGEGQIISEKDIPLLESVGNQISVALENAQLYQETSQRLNELQSLTKTTALISSNLDQNTLFNTIIDEAMKVFKTDAVSIMLLDDQEDMLVIKAAAGLSQEYIKRQKIPRNKAEAVIDLKKTQAPIFTHDLMQTPFGNLKLIKQEGIISNLATPLISDQKILGVLNLYSKNEPRDFTEHEISLARAFGDQVSIAIDNARSYETVVRSENEHRFLYEIGQTIVSSLDLDQTLKFIVESIPSLFPSYSTAIMLLNEEGTELRVKAYKGPKNTERTKASISIDSSVSGSVVKSGIPIIVSDVNQNPLYLKGLDEVRSEICVPLIHKGKTIGVIDLESDLLNAYNERHEYLLTSLANMAAIAIENARSYEESERWSSHLRSIQKLGSDLNKILDVKQIAFKVVHELIEVLDSDDCRIYILDENKSELNPIAQWSKASQYNFKDLEVLKVNVGEGITGNVALTGKPELIDDANLHPHAVTIPGTEDVDESMLLSPMLFENRVKGVISLSKLGLKQFTPGHLRLLTIFADEAAIALENARLHEERMDRLAEINRLKDFNEAIVDGLEEGILIQDDLGNLTFINPKLEQISGYKSKELIGKHWSTLFSSRFHPAIAEESRRHLQGQSSRYEAALQNKNGEEIPIFICARPLFSQGRLISVLTAISDISELKRMELKMVRNARLRALGEMSGGVAHDFNNVLGAILGRVQLLIKTNSNPRLIEGLRIIEKAALDGAETVKRIQDFTRTRTDDKFLQIDINEIVLDAVSMTRVRWKEEADAEGITINVETNLNSLPLTIGNPGELREVLTNLIFNSIDALPQGGKVSLSTRKEGGYILVTVEDNGTGIEPSIIDKIFDPFFSTKGVKGTGLGLSVSYGIISRHKGEIMVNSRLGRGSLFTIKLPIVELQPASPDEQIDTVAFKTNLNIIVIDDEPALRNLLADILTLEGHRVWTANGGIEGVRLAKEYNPDIVFTDLGMPAMSGWEVVREIKRNKNIPVIMVTGWGDQIDKNRLKESRVDAVIAKPFSIDEIHRVVQNLHEKGRFSSK